MLSERARASLVLRAVRRAVLRAVDSNLTVARNSVAEHALPSFTFLAHFKASAMVVIFDNQNTSSGENLGLNEGGVL